MLCYSLQSYYNLHFQRVHDWINRRIINNNEQTITHMPTQGQINKIASTANPNINDEYYAVELTSKLTYEHRGCQRL